jgi:hypothetical protein
MEVSVVHFGTLYILQGVGVYSRWLIVNGAWVLLVMNEDGEIPTNNFVPRISDTRCFVEP